jgi:cytochrome c553
VREQWGAGYDIAATGYQCLVLAALELTRPDANVQKGNLTTLTKEGEAMRPSISNLWTRFWLTGILLIGCLTIPPYPNVWASPSPSPPASKAQGDAELGRKLFNGKGYCYQCHGIEGYIDRRPQLAPEIANMIAHLDPTPADFRNPTALKFKNDKGRFRTIKEGHRGTAMLPKAFLSDQEITDILAYLSVLRSEATSTGKGRQKEHD